MRSGLRVDRVWLRTNPRVVCSRHGSVAHEEMQSLAQRLDGLRSVVSDAKQR
jgi:hypothetical protein